MYDEWDKKTLGELRETRDKTYERIVQRFLRGFSAGKRYQILTAYIDLVKYIHDRELKSEDGHV